MKLFSANELKQKKDLDMTREVLRTQEMQKVADKARKEMSNSEADFKEMLAKNKEKWSQEELEHAQRVKEMEAEVKVLENKKQQALIPIEIYKDSANELMKEAARLIGVAKQHEDENEELKENLEDKLDDVGDREIKVSDRESKVLLREQGSLLQNQQIIEGVKKLSKEMSLFTAKKLKEEKDIEEIKTALFLKERTLVAKEETLNITKKTLEEWEIRLKDQRNVLETELKRRGIPF